MKVLLVDDRGGGDGPGQAGGTGTGRRLLGPDVILINITRSGQSGLETVHRVKAEIPSVKTRDYPSCRVPDTKGYSSRAADLYNLVKLQT